MKKYVNDIEIIKSKYKQLPKYWDGKKSILELKEVNYNWRQMEWWGFYFEYKFHQLFQNDFNRKIKTEL